MATHSSALAWKLPWMEEPGRLQSMGWWKVRHDWATSLSLFTFLHWRRKWQPTPAFLPGESQGRRSLVGCRLWGHTELDTTEVTQQQQQQQKWLSSLWLQALNMWLRTWPITVTYSPDHSHWSRERHMTQPEPIRVPPWDFFFWPEQPGSSSFLFDLEAIGRSAWRCLQSFMFRDKTGWERKEAQGRESLVPVTSRAKAPLPWLGVSNVNQ